MNNDFINIFLQKLGDDLARFSIEFPVFVITFFAMLLIVTFVFGKRKWRNYDEIVACQNDKQLKKVMKQLRDEKIVDVPDVGMGEMLGIDIYIYQGIDFLFTGITPKNSENRFVDREKKLIDYLRRNEKYLTNLFKKNIVHIFLKLENEEAARVSLFHVYFFAIYFPYYTDVNLVGDFIIDIDNFSVEDIVEAFEDEEDPFVFSKYFYMIIGRINAHEMEMSTYIKIKDIFAKQIKEQETQMETKKRKNASLVVRKNKEVKTKEIYYNFIPKKREKNNEELKWDFQENRADENPKKEEQNSSEETPQNSSQNNEENSSQNSSKNSDETSKNQSAKKSKNKSTKFGENKSKKKFAKPIQKNGKYTNENLENKKEILEDIEDQRRAAEILNAEVEKEEEIPEEIEELNQEELEKIKEMLLGKKDEKEEQDHKTEDTPQDEKTELKDDVPEKEEEEVFEVAKEAAPIQKKDFHPLRDFFKLLKKFDGDTELNEKMFLVFEMEDSVYVSVQYLYLKTTSLYKTDEKYAKNLMEFAHHVSSGLKIKNKNRELEYKSIKIKIADKDLQASSLFLIFPKNMVEKHFSNDFSKTIKKVENIQRYDFKKIDLLEYLKEEKCCE